MMKKQISTRVLLDSCLGTWKRGEGENDITDVSEGECEASPDPPSCWGKHLAFGRAWKRSNDKHDEVLFFNERPSQRSGRSSGEGVSIVSPPSCWGEHQDLYTLNKCY